MIEAHTEHYLWTQKFLPEESKLGEWHDRSHNPAISLWLQDSCFMYGEGLTLYHRRRVESR